MGRYPEFIEHLHKLLARSQNALRGRWEDPPTKPVQVWPGLAPGVADAWSAAISGHILPQLGID